MSELAGRYTVDIANSAKLRTGWFENQSSVDPRHLEEVETLFQANAEAICDVTLTLGSDSLTLSSEDGEETFRVLSLPPSTPGQMVVDWHGAAIAFNVVALGADVFHFQSEINALAAWAWCKVSSE